jgi:hypothetical protein
LFGVLDFLEQIIESGLGNGILTKLQKVEQGQNFFRRDEIFLFFFDCNDVDDLFKDHIKEFLEHFWVLIG